ncbi:MAG: efflux RND transporter periplasmic adaptor subunit, partial [Propionicimonas sp.]|nr:efflux RND transporter periplasmic adaptor subunit [Propionicimonas sp.]
ARIQQKTIRAPFTGQIGIRRVNMGQYLNAGDPIATLTKLDPLYVNFTVPQQELPKLKIDGKVNVAVDTLPDKVFIANINSIEPRINSDTRNVIVQAILPNVDRQVKSGMYVNVRVQLPAIADAITVPLTAIQTSASGDSIIVVQDPNAEGIGKTLAVPVKTGRHLGDDVIIEEGLKPGDVVVTAGQVRIPPGAPVKISAPSLSQSDAPDSAPIH